MEKRLFIAVNFPALFKKALVKKMQPLREIPSEVRWVEEENLHLTIQK